MSYYSLSYAIQTTVDVISGSTNPIDYSWPLNNSPLDEYDNKIIDIQKKLQSKFDNSNKKIKQLNIKTLNLNN